MKTWDMLKTVYSVADFISWYKSSALELSPSFQRRPVWKVGAKSFLIDTIIRGLPIPIIFLRDRKANLGSLKSMREVVDGQQRIRTILSFVIPGVVGSGDTFVMSKAHNKDLAGKKFSELPTDIRQRILDYQFSVHVMPANVDDREVLQIFARMNATGVKLNSQELRNAEFFGEFKTVMYDLASAQLSRWRDWGLFSEYNIARMDEVEFTSELAIMMIKGIVGKTQTAIDNIYDERDKAFSEKAEVSRRFEHVLDQIEDNVDVPGTIFRNKTLFYSLFSAIYTLHYDSAPIDKRTSPTKIPSSKFKKIIELGGLIEKSKAPESVLEASARRTTHVSSRKAIVAYLLKA